MSRELYVVAKHTEEGGRIAIYWIKPKEFPAVQARPMMRADMLNHLLRQNGRAWTLPEDAPDVVAARILSAEVQAVKGSGGWVITTEPNDTTKDNLAYLPERPRPAA